MEGLLAPGVETRLVYMGCPIPMLYMSPRPITYSYGWGRSLWKPRVVDFMRFDLLALEGLF